MYIENGSAVGENEAMIPMAADDCKNKNYQEIEEVFKNAGFTNISLDIVYDISFGITEEGSVKDITVDGKADFKRGEIFAKDVLINIFYHMKAEDDPEKQSSESSDVVEESDNNNTISSSDTILTKENNEDLAVLLTADAVDGDAQAKFVQKYSGKTIEFDCIVMTLLEEPKYDTIYSYILIPGEDKDSIGATLFYIDRIGFYGFNWDKQTRPEFVASGSRLRLRARVTTGEDTAFIYLEPIKTWGRE